MNIFIKMRFFTTKKDGSTWPTALESDGPYFEIMGQWPGPTINQKACFILSLVAVKKKNTQNNIPQKAQKKQNILAGRLIQP